MYDVHYMYTLLKFSVDMLSYEYNDTGSRRRGGRKEGRRLLSIISVRIILCLNAVARNFVVSRLARAKINVCFSIELLQNINIDNILFF